MQPQMKTTSEDTLVVRSPLSTLPPIKVRDLPRTFLLDELESQYKTRPPLQAVEMDYSLWQCVETGLQFAWPMLPGNTIFYEWASSFESYYPGERWEYRKVRSILKAEKLLNGKSKVLDAGCGKGDFLQKLDFVQNECKFALDFNESAVQACRQQGFQAFCGEIETALVAGFLHAAELSVVTSFHCLEHVNKPVEFVQALLKVTAPGGRVFVSTPYSPMSTESDSFDILNHPPHHLTRWNLTAYRRLAAMLGVKMRYFVPPSGAAKRALKALWVLKHGTRQQIRKAKLLADLMHDFPAFLRQYRKHVERERTNQGIGADVILVELTAP
jgi:2-polyprenyl-3-methyl-5-hydroxy-6-metoxy-1,4-benzoquinol methylase